MSQDDTGSFELSRRKALAALGTIGAASAGAGLGTSAYFSDKENYPNNTLTAGSLDLKVDWEEHYSDWSDDEMVTLETEDGAMDGIRMDEPSDMGDWVAMPTPDDPLIYVHVDALDQFMTNTAIEAYPDDGDNGSQSLHRYSESEYCDILADTPDGLNPDRDDPARTMNDDTWDSEAGEPKPLIALDDVKPGDFGELTLSFHLCDNPGYVWLQGDLVSAAENGHTEPERKDPDEVGGPNTQNTTGNDVELLDAVQTMLWYDEDGDNVYEPGGEAGEAVDVVLVLDRSGSMGGSKMAEQKTAAKNLIDALALGPDAAQVGVVSFADQENLDQGLTTDGNAAKNAVEGLSAAGSTNLEGGVNGGEEELTAAADYSAQVTPSGNDRDDADKVMVVLTDGSPNVDDDSPTSSDTGDSPLEEATRAKGNDVEIFTIGFGFDAGDSEAVTLEDMASESDNFFLGDEGTLAQIFGQISQQIAGEECFFEGTLGELLEAASAGNGIPLDGDRATPFDEVNGDPAAMERDPFVEATLNNLGFAWWLPVDHANEVQTDSVEFDIGFYTEQARHNDGAGMGPEVTTSTGTGFVNAEEGFNGDGSQSSFARARYGDNNGTAGAWELAVGDAPGSAAEGNYEWTPGEAVPFTYSYDAATDEATFTLDGTTVGAYGLADQPDGRVGIQAKADEATVDVTDVGMSVAGTEAVLAGPTSVTATNDGSGRALDYLVIDSALDGETSFEVSGMVTVSLQGDYDNSAEEGVAMDVVLE